MGDEKKEIKKVVTLKFQSALDVDYKLGEMVWFYLSNSLELAEGRIIGFFATVDENDVLSYIYQIEYYKDQKDGTVKLYIGNVSSEEINVDKGVISKHFEDTRNERIDKVLEDYKVELDGAKTNMNFHEEIIKEIQGEIGRIEGLKREA